MLFPGIFNFTVGILLRTAEDCNQGVTQVGRFKMDQRADGTLAIGIFFSSPFRTQSHIPVDK